MYPASWGIPSQEAFQLDSRALAEGDCIRWFAGLEDRPGGDMSSEETSQKLKSDAVRQGGRGSCTEYQDDRLRFIAPHFCGSPTARERVGRDAAGDEPQPDIRSLPQKLSQSGTGSVRPA